MAIKAPPEAKLHVPHPSDGLQIYMSSENGEIEVRRVYTYGIDRPPLGGVPDTYSAPLAYLGKGGRGVRV
jgi:hypothetical protein